VKKGTPRRTWQTRGARYLLLLWIVVRVLLTLTVLQTTGLPLLVREAVVALCSDAPSDGHRDEECPDEREGRECPPGCPGCHCQHPMGALPPIIAAPFLLELPADTEVALAPYEAQAPPEPAPSSIYRPPRPACA
jgi:hypothetical protein